MFALGQARRVALEGESGACAVQRSSVNWMETVGGSNGPWRCESRRIACRSIIRHPAASRRCSRTWSVTEARFEIAAHSERGDPPMPLDDTTMDLDSYARSLVLWMVGVAAAVYVGKVVLRRLPTGWVRTAPGHFRVPDRFALFLVGMATLLIV